MVKTNHSGHWAPSSKKRNHLKNLNPMRKNVATTQPKTSTRRRKEKAIEDETSEEAEEGSLNSRNGKCTEAREEDTEVEETAITITTTMTTTQDKRIEGIITMTGMRATVTSTSPAIMIGEMKGTMATTGTMATEMSTMTRGMKKRGMNVESSLGKEAVAEAEETTGRNMTTIEITSTGMEGATSKSTNQSSTKEAIE